ncbi:hypothetical protein MTO96_003303 [Rhipicephalus appendiculatus]
MAHGEESVEEMEAVPRDLPQSGQAECRPSATSPSTSIKGSSGCGPSTETSTITPHFIPDTEASKSVAGTLAGTPLVGQQSRSAKGIANDDECDIGDGDPHDPVYDPAVHGDTARYRHGKGDRGDGGGNKKTAVEGPATAKDEGARHDTKEALILETNGGHGLDAGKEENFVVVVVQESVSVEAPKSAAGSRFNTRAVTTAVTTAAAKLRRNAAKDSKATAVKAVAPRMRAATRKPDSECVVIARLTTCTATKTVSAATKSTSSTSPTSVSKSASAVRARVKTSYDATEDGRGYHRQRTFSQGGGGGGCVEIARIAP